ncbi:MAG: amidohydrolase [Hyphomicrobiales bacterium]|nr:amidohydrolase [Hyphomicrobiales bacterium]
MLIDWHVHINDPKFLGPPWWRHPVPMTLQHALDAHALVGLDRTVISNAVHYIRHMETDREIVAALESSNRHLAWCRDQHPDKFVFMATCVPGGGDAYWRELERAVKEDDARAVIINSSHHGHYPDDDAARPFFKLVTDLDIPVFVHPGDATTPAMADYRLASSIGRPADNCLSLARLIVRGIFEQFPTLKVVGSHLGGGICEVIGRMDYAYELLDFSVFLGPYEPMLIKHAPSHYLKMMYFDSACYAAPAVECCLKTVGEDHFLFGTDSPPMVPLKKKGFEMMSKIGMTPAQYAKVMGGNAARLLKIN